MGKSSLFLLLLLLLTPYYLLLSPSPAYAVIQNPVFYKIAVSATIGEPKLTLFGYSSPNAWIELKGTRVSEQTMANQQGYFFFKQVFLPRPRPNYPELCLTSIDTHQRLAFPTCLPPLPTGPYEITVGPVLLPPTISLEKGNFLPQEQIAAQGSTIPNAEMTIFLGYDLSSIPSISLISPAYAYSLPKYQIRSDEEGSFEFNLPANWPANWRVFASAVYLGSPTPKSNTLVFKVLSIWEWLWKEVKTFFSFVAPYLWQLIILAEIIVIILLSKTYFHSLGQDFALYSRLDKIISRRSSGDVKNRST